MPIPRSNRMVFGRNPLAEVICQLKFPTILAISTEAPSAFQERVRGGYPLYRRLGGEISLPPGLAPLLGNLPVQFQGQSASHQFLTADSQRSIALNQDFVALTENRYRQWEDFLRELILAETALREVYQPAFYSRVGLRYQNIIDREALDLTSRDWDALIEPPFAGLLGAEPVKRGVREQGSVVLFDLDEIEGARCRVQSGLTQVPALGRQVFVIDADFFREGNFTNDDAFALLETFHEFAGNLFRWAITPSLRGALQPTRS